MNCFVVLKPPSDHASLRSDFLREPKMIFELDLQDVRQEIRISRIFEYPRHERCFLISESLDDSITETKYN